MDELKLKGYQSDNLKTKNIEIGRLSVGGINTETIKTTLQPTIYVPSLDFRIIDNSMYLAILIRRLWR